MYSHANFTVDKKKIDHGMSDNDLKVISVN